MHIMVPPSDAPFSVTVAEHQPRLIQRFIPPVKVVWIIAQPSNRFRLEFAYGRQVVIAPVVTIHF